MFARVYSLSFISLDISDSVKSPTFYFKGEAVSPKILGRPISPTVPSGKISCFV